MAKKTVKSRNPVAKSGATLPIPLVPESSSPLGLAPKDWPANMFGSESDAFDQLLESGEEWHSSMVSEGKVEYQKGQTKPLEP